MSYNGELKNQFVIPSVDSVMASLEGKKVYFRDVYLFESDVKVDIEKIYCPFWEGISNKEMREMYEDFFLSTKKVIDKYTVMMYDDFDNEGKEIVTGIVLPQLNVKCNRKTFSISFISKPYLRSNGERHGMGSTKLLVLGDKKYVDSIDEVREYVHTFLDKAHYDVLLRMLAGNMESCSFDNEYGLQFLNPYLYISEDVLGYYREIKDKRSYLTLKKQRIKK